MRHLPLVVGILVGLLFAMASVTFLAGMVPPQPAPPAGSPMEGFTHAFMGTGYMAFVKVMELLGAVCVAVPRLRRAGLLILGPILVNILAFHAFVLHGSQMMDPLLAVVVLAILYLTWVERAAFARFLARE